MEIKALLVAADAELNQIMCEGGCRKDAAAAVYITEVPELAQKLLAGNVPFLYVEEPGTPQTFIPGVDVIYQGKLDHKAGQEGRYGLDGEFLLRVWQRHFHLPWTIAETERLVIRESIMEDLPQLLEIYAGEAGNPDVAPFSGEPREEFKAYIDNRYPLYGYGLWSVAEKASGRVIGRAGLEECAEGIELAYLIENGRRGQGYAREAAGAILQYAKEELGAGEIYLRTSDENTASLALAHRLCFKAYRSDTGKKIFRLYL